MTLDVSPDIQFIHVFTPFEGGVGSLYRRPATVVLTTDFLLIDFFPGLGCNNGLETDSQHPALLLGFNRTIVIVGAALTVFLGKMTAAYLFIGVSHASYWFPAIEASFYFICFVKGKAGQG